MSTVIGTVKLILSFASDDINPVQVIDTLAIQPPRVYFNANMHAKWNIPPLDISYTK